ncbi:Asp-tRNA(Asn)/Glu-tRNA(Gln) amidotransferase subunit GatC [Nannocystaceae bacterium ST9]
MSGTSDHERLARELAGLARLELRDHEAAQFGEQLAAILGYIDKLREVDVEGVPEYLTAEQETSGLRADEALAEVGVEQALAGVPARRGRLIAVPKFKED